MTVDRHAFPGWLKARLSADGLMDRDTGAVRKARATYCGKCNAHIFRGLDADWGSLSRDVDTQPLNRLGEALILLNGRRTFSLRWVYDHFIIDTRGRFIIPFEPAGSVPTVDVVSEHECGAAPVVPFDQPRARKSTPRAHLPDEPPF